MINISYIDSEVPLRDNMWITAEPRYKNTDLDFKSLVDFVKSDYIQYSPYNYINETKVSSSWDNSRQNLLVFDIDDGFTIEQAKSLFAKYEYIITTTKSHRVEKKGIICDRFRILLPAINIPKGEIYFDMLEVMADSLPMDRQVNTKTGAFLGCSNAISWYNEGIPYDCKKALHKAEIRLMNRIKRVKFNDTVSSENLELKRLKMELTVETVIDILEHLGYETRGSKFKLRAEERTPSAKIYENGYIIDYGSGFKGDIFDVLKENHNMLFNQSIPFVSKFL